MITIIAAIAKNNALGKDNDLIWHLPEDLKRFKKTTTGHSRCTLHRQIKNKLKPSTPDKLSSEGD